MSTRNLERAATLALILLALETPLAAYSDPGSGVLLWQMLAAGVVGSLFYLRKLTGWFDRRRRGPKD